MSKGRENWVKMGRHLEKNPHTLNFQKFKCIMDKLDAQLIREANERKAKKDGKRTK